MLLIITVSLFSAVTAITNSTVTNNRNKRQLQYTCGTAPYIFTSDLPCEMYPQCRNGGFRFNIGCTNDYVCQIYQPSVCLDQCCCTLPVVVGATTRRFLDQACSHIGFFVAVTISLLYTLF